MMARLINWLKVVKNDFVLRLHTSELPRKPIVVRIIPNFSTVCNCLWYPVTLFSSCHIFMIYHVHLVDLSYYVDLNHKYLKCEFIALSQHKKSKFGVIFGLAYVGLFFSNQAKIEVNSLKEKMLAIFFSPNF